AGAFLAAVFFAAVFFAGAASAGAESVDSDAVESVGSMPAVALDGGGSCGGFCEPFDSVLLVLLLFVSSSSMCAPRRRPIPIGPVPVRRCALRGGPTQSLQVATMDLRSGVIGRTSVTCRGRRADAFLSRMRCRVAVWRRLPLTVPG